MSIPVTGIGCTGQKKVDFCHKSSIPYILGMLSPCPIGDSTNDKLVCSVLTQNSMKIDYQFRVRALFKQHSQTDIYILQHIGVSSICGSQPLDLSNCLNSQCDISSSQKDYGIANLMVSQNMAHSLDQLCFSRQVRCSTFQGVGYLADHGVETLEIGCRYSGGSQPT